MSNIDAQIKALLLKKKKIDYVSYILDLIKNDTKCIDFKEVQQDVVSQIEPFLKSLSESIETDAPIKSESTVLTPQQIEALKLVADKVISKPSNQVTPSQNNQAFTSEPKPKKEENFADKMTFALNNRHLGNKRVQVLNDKNAQIFGTVVGLDAPFVIVKTDTGPTINVPLEKVVPQ